MNIEEFREYCMAIPGTTENTPFIAEDVVVFKVAEKMFAMFSLTPKDGVFRVDLKCHPERSVELREQYAGINPSHVPTTLLWNRITLESDVPDSVIIELIRHSVNEVLRNLPRAHREAYFSRFFKPLKEMSNEELWQLFPVELTAYNPEWPEQFAREKKRLLRIVGKGNTERISHIGSTAIEDMTAKPTIDILLEICPNTDIPEFIRNMESAGYICLPQPRKPAPALMFLKGYTPLGFIGEVFHVHVRYPGDWEEIRFRDYLRSHPQDAVAYGKLKQSLLSGFRNDRDGYTAAKSDFTGEILRKAKAD